ncbi:MAG: IS1595 family transposase [Candidatus Poribacteria bacterium]|nr:IS1595 family transposase [Candidatus Poribacteria bacterium]
MDILEIMQKFPDQDACIKHLEEIRWGDGNATCPHCDSTEVGRKNESQDDGKVGRTGRWNCYDCKASFKVTCGTVFHGTKIALQKWFVAIALIMNAKKSLSSHQLGRDLDLNQKTAWSMVHKIRAEMLKKTNALLLRGIIEADETYIGGKPRKANKKEDRKPSKRGRGTEKTAILGAVQRGGKVVAQVATELTGKAIYDFIKRYVKIKDSELMTDEFHAYTEIGKEMKHHIINHQEQYVEGDKHTNTIEGFWSLLKRAWYGTHHHFSVTYTPLYVAEACYKYNYRHIDNIFAKFVSESMKLKKGGDSK